MKFNTCTYSLTIRDKQILYLIANGNSNSDIALKLCLSTNTIKADVSAILKKLKVKNRAHAVYVALLSNQIE